MTGGFARLLIDTVNKLRQIENFTQEGRHEHPIQAHLGDIANRIEGFTFGNEQHPEAGIGTGQYGMLTNPVTGNILPVGKAGTPAAAEAIESAANLAKGGYQAVKSALAGGKAAEHAPGFVRRVMQGEKVTQVPTEEALRSGARAAGGKGSNASLRTVLEEPIDNIEHGARATYREVDRAAGTDFKALREKLENTEYQIRQLTETEEDVAKEAALEKSRTGILDKMEAAKQQAIKAGVDPTLLEQADAQFKQASALKDLQAKVFKNTNVISGNQAMGAEETINVNNAVKELQKLQDAKKFGSSRLEQALGKEGAQGLLRDMYAAQKAGINAIKSREMVAKLARWAAYGGGALAGGKMILHSMLGE
jgi:hypothetical protein